MTKTDRQIAIPGKIDISKYRCLFALYGILKDIHIHPFKNFHCGVFNGI